MTKASRMNKYEVERDFYIPNRVCFLSCKPVRLRKFHLSSPNCCQCQRSMMKVSVVWIVAFSVVILLFLQEAMPVTVTEEDKRMDARR